MLVKFRLVLGENYSSKRAVFSTSNWKVAKNMDKRKIAVNEFYNEINEYGESWGIDGPLPLNQADRFLFSDKKKPIPYIRFLFNQQQKRKRTKSPLI